MGRWNRAKKLTCLGWFAVVVVACSSGSGSPGTGGGGSLDCAGLCQKAKASCPNTDTTNCTGECQSDLNSAQCGQQLSAYGSCLSSRGTFVCDADGEVDDVNGCDSEIQSYAACLACAPDPDDGACETCEKTTCCNQLKALFNHPQLQAYSDCVDLCTDTDCYQACATQFSSYTTAATAYSDCVQSCASSC